VSPVAGDLWWESDSGQLYVYYNDGTSNQWVAVAPTATATGDVVGPPSVTSGNPAIFSGTSGKLITETTYSAFKSSLILVKDDVGLGSVDNTSDLAKPISTATQAALDLKQPLDIQLSEIAALAPTLDNFIVGNGTSWTLETPALARTSLGLGTAAVLNTGVSGGTIPRFDGASGLWTGLHTFSRTDNNYNITLLGTDDATPAAAGPILRLFRDSATPSAGDILGSVQFHARDSAAVETVFGIIYAAMDDPTDTLEASHLRFWTRQAGAGAIRFRMGNGFYYNGGVDPGANAINATALQIAGVDLFARTNTWTGQNSFQNANVLINPTSGQATLQVRSLTPNGAYTNYYGGAAGTNARWSIGKNTTAEGGSNAGADFQLWAYADDGSSLGRAFLVNRATRAMTVDVSLTSPIINASSTLQVAGVNINTIYAPLASPALTGTPTVPTAAPGTNTTQAASTAFVAAAIAAAPDVTISDTAPGSPIVGDLWWESDSGKLFIYFNDGTSSQWVDAAAAAGASGDVIGPSSSVNGNPVVFNGTSGKVVGETTFASFKTSLALTKSDVGLANVDNTSDLAKPISTDTQAALDLKGPAPNVVQITTTQTLTAADDGKTLLCDATAAAITINLPPVATSLNFRIMVMKVDASANSVILDPNAAELIETVSTFSMTQRWQTCTLVCDGLKWVREEGQLATTAVWGLAIMGSTTQVLTGTDGVRASTPDSIAALWEQNATPVASAALVTFGEGGYFTVSGAVTITDIDFTTDKAGRRAWVLFTGAPLLTHSATLILPGAVNYQVTAGDVAEIISEGTDIIRVLSITRVSGKPVVMPNATDVGLGNVSNNPQVTSVTGTAPVVSSGGTTPAISIPAAASGVSGHLTAADWATFNSKQPGDTTLTALAGLDATAGYVVQTGTDTFTKRSLAAGTGITISNPAGTAGNSSIAVDTATIFANAALTGNPTAPTATPGDNDTSIATTAFVSAAIAASGGNPPATTTEVLTGTATNKDVTPDALAALWEKGTTVASAATISLGEGGFFHISGTTTITDIDFATAKDGRTAWVVFDASLILTHNATTLHLPGDANIVTAAGDTACFVQDAADNVVCVAYNRANGAAVVPDPPYRNRIINGDFRVDQRGATTYDVSSGPTYTMDRWRSYCVGGGTLRAVRTGSLVGGSSYYCVASAFVADASLAAGDVYIYNQCIEGLNVADLLWGTANAKPITLSFNIGGNASYTLAISVQNSNNTRAYVTTIPVSTTYYRATITIPGDTSGTWLKDTGVGLQISFVLGSGTTFNAPAANAWQAGNYISVAGASNIMATANNYIAFWDVQLEPGNVATEFERRLYGTELLLCQRYYQQYGGGGQYPRKRSFTNASGYNLTPITFTQPMRATPTVVRVGNWSAGNCTSPQVSGANQYGVNIQVQSTLGTAGETDWYPTDSTGLFTFSAEL
jgi:hypothetical protein